MELIPRQNSCFINEILSILNLVHRTVFQFKENEKMRINVPSFLATQQRNKTSSQLHKRYCVN